MLAMVQNPRVAKKAQSELDSVLQNQRLPTFEDQSALPYIQCILKECLR
jgi:cytochrome P450